LNPEPPGSRVPSPRSPSCYSCRYNRPVRAIGPGGHDLQGERTMKKQWVLAGILASALGVSDALAQHQTPNQQPNTATAPTILSRTSHQVILLGGVSNGILTSGLTYNATTNGQKHSTPNLRLPSSQHQIFLPRLIIPCVSPGIRMRTDGSCWARMNLRG